MPERHLTIGTVASLTGLTVKALRHYDDIGLLRPDRVDQRTGYRQYSPDQLRTAAEIALLRAVDMPLSDIAIAVTSTMDRERLLDAHRDRLLEHRTQIDHYLARIDHLKESPVTDVQIRRFPETPIHRVSRSADEETRVQWPTLPEGGALLSWGEVSDDGQVTVHFAVEDPQAPNDTLATFDAAVACTSDAENIPAILAAALDWLHDRHREMSRPPIERLIPRGANEATIELWIPLTEPGTPGLDDLRIEPVEVVMDVPRSQ